MFQLGRARQVKVSKENTIIVDSADDATEPYKIIESWSYKADVYAYAYYQPVNIVLRYF